MALIITVIVLVGFSLVLCLIILLTMKTSRRITKTITEIDSFTKELKTMTDLASKQKKIKEFSSKDMFRKISKQYDKMEQAKQILEDKLYQLKLENIAKHQNNISTRVENFDFAIKQSQQNTADTVSKEVKPIKPGTELKQIQKWEKLEDELDEL